MIMRLVLLRFKYRGCDANGSSGFNVLIPRDSAPAMLVIRVQNVILLVVVIPLVQVSNETI